MTTPPQPPEGRSRERTRRHPPPRTPRPITGPAAAASSRDGLCRPRCCRRRPSPVGRREESASPGTAATVGEFPGRQDAEGGWVGRSAGRRRRADGSGNSGAPGSIRPEPPRLRLTIGSGRSALALIGACTSRPTPGAGWEMESTCRPHAHQHDGSWRRRSAQNRNLPSTQVQEAVSAAGDPGKASLAPLQPFEEERPSVTDLQ